MSEKDGGPAFPRSGVPTVMGMTLRQFYKAAALSALLSPEMVTSGLSMPRTVAAIAGEFADALIAEDEEHAKSGS